MLPARVWRLADVAERRPASADLSSDHLLVCPVASLRILLTLRLSPRARSRVSAVRVTVSSQLARVACSCLLVMSFARTLPLSLVAIVGAGALLCVERLIARLGGHGQSRSRARPQDLILVVRLRSDGRRSPIPLRLRIFLKRPPVFWNLNPPSLVSRG